MGELIFKVTQEADGGFVAEALGESIITQADTWNELRKNVREAVRALEATWRGALSGSKSVGRVECSEAPTNKLARRAA